MNKKKHNIYLRLNDNKKIVYTLEIMVTSYLSNDICRTLLDFTITSVCLDLYTEQCTILHNEQYCHLLHSVQYCHLLFSVQYCHLLYSTVYHNAIHCTILPFTLQCIYYLLCIVQYCHTQYSVQYCHLLHVKCTVLPSGACTVYSTAICCMHSVQYCHQLHVQCTVLLSATCKLLQSASFNADLQGVPRNIGSWRIV